MSLCQISSIKTIETICTNDTTLEKRSICLSIVNKHIVVVQILSYCIQKTFNLIKIVIAAELTMKVIIVAIYIPVISLLNKIIKGLGQLFFIHFGLPEKI